jgi:hypothetical protein
MYFDYQSKPHLKEVSLIESKTLHLEIKQEELFVLNT